MNNTHNFSILHLFNTNFVEIKNLIQYINDFGYPLNAVSDKDFAAHVTHYLNKDDLKNSISGIIPDLSKDKILDYISTIQIHADISNSFLNAIGFNWPNLDKFYFEKYFNFLEKINYFIKKEN